LTKFINKTHISYQSHRNPNYYEGSYVEKDMDRFWYNHDVFKKK